MWPKSRGPFLEKPGKTLADGLWACHAPQLRDVPKECVTLYKVSHLPAESLFQSKQKLRSACLKGKLKLECLHGKPSSYQKNCRRLEGVVTKKKLSAQHCIIKYIYLAQYSVQFVSQTFSWMFFRTNDKRSDSIGHFDPGAVLSG